MLIVNKKNKLLLKTNPIVMMHLLKDLNMISTHMN